MIIELNTKNSINTLEEKMKGRHNECAPITNIPPFLAIASSSIKRKKIPSMLFFIIT